MASGQNGFASRTDAALPDQMVERYKLAVATWRSTRCPFLLSALTPGMLGVKGKMRRVGDFRNGGVVAGRYPVTFS